MKKEVPKWDVSDIDPTTMFLKDCRYYNGDIVAPEKVKQFWEKNSGKVG